MRTGWRKQWRKVWDNPIFQGHPNRYAVWGWLLDHVQWEAGTRVRFGGETIELKPGQMTCGAYQIAKETGVPRGTVERVLLLLKSEEQIEVRSDHQCSLVTVKNWDLYQGNEEQSEERVRNDRGTSEERVRTNKEDKKVRREENKKTNVSMAADAAARADGGGFEDFSDLSEVAAASPPPPSSAPPPPVDQAEVVDPLEMEYRQMLPLTSKILGHTKVFTREGLKQWRARRKTFSARELGEAFLNLQREPDRWKIINNGFRELSWWLQSDDRIRGMQNCHLKNQSLKSTVRVAEI